MGGGFQNWSIKGYQVSLLYENVDWKTIQAKLKPKKVAIEITRAVFIDSTQKEKIMYGVLILTSQTKETPEMVVFENGTEMEGKFFKNYRNMIKGQTEDKYSYKVYWQPIAEKLKTMGDFTKIYWASDGVFQQISLNTLINTENKRYVLEDFTIQQLTSTKDILTLGKKTTKQTIKTARLFGRPTYEVQQSTFQKQIEASPPNVGRDVRFDEGLAQLDIKDLPATETEIQSIESMLQAQKFNKVESFFLENATEEEVKRTQKPTILHIATHGFWYEALDSTRAHEPMLYSGILLAGIKNFFKSAIKPDTDDGVLTAYEAMNMDLEGTELVVLSACETGLGKLETGEGVFGLQRAFQVAGAKAVITSLWTVEDAATNFLMSAFYEALPTASTKLEAFRIAQIKTKTAYPKPYYWGAFVMVGE